MKTIREFAQDSNIEEGLIRAVVRQCGGWDSFKEMAPDVANYGASGGFHGFIYYTDTLAFFHKNRDEIKKACSSLAEDLGENVLDMIGGFRCIEGSTSEEVGETLYGPKSKADTQVANCLAWYALEEVCQSYTDLADH